MLRINNTEQFEMKGTEGRFIYCGEVHDTATLRVYIYFYDTVTHKKYIEEITGGKLCVVEDMERWQELVDYGTLYNIFPSFIKKGL